MTTTRKPRPPRAAGPKPRTVPKKPPRLCGNGHHVAARWRTDDPCWQCEADERRRAAADPALAAAIRAAASADLTPLPDEIVIRSGDGRSTLRFSIPRGARPARSKRRRRP